MQTVVGVFDTTDEAQNARDALLGRGFDASEVRLQSNPAAQASTTDRTITGEEGFMASIGRFFSDLFGNDDRDHAGHYSEAVRRGSTVVAVTVSDPGRAEDARSTLAAAGAVDIDKRTESWREQGYAGFDPSAQPYHPDQIAAERSRYQSASLRSSDDLLAPDGTRVDPVKQGTALPVVRENLEIGKREVDLGTVRVFSRTETRPVEEQDPLRDTVVEVDKSGNATLGTAAPDYRSHYDANRASLDGAYEDFEPAYQYGSSLRADPRYANRSWDEVEAEARDDWAHRYPTGASTWEKTKMAVRHGWESMTGRR